ncbi:MAG: hypothetical protein ACREMD_10350 [Gemmatimonadota bacterium]
MRFCLSPVLALSLLPLAIVACSSCSDDGPTAPRDTGSPLIEVRFPTSAAAIDRDGDGLVDLEVAFSDPGSGIDGATIRLTADRSLKGGPVVGSELTEVWTVPRADSAGLVIEETVDHLLPRGEVRLTVSVADRAGNPMSRQVTLELPPAARHRVLDLDADLKFNTGQITVGPEGRKGCSSSTPTRVGFRIKSTFGPRTHRDWEGGSTSKWTEGISSPRRATGSL